MSVRPDSTRSGRVGYRRSVEREPRYRDYLRDLAATEGENHERLVRPHLIRAWVHPDEDTSEPDRFKCVVGGTPATPGSTSARSRLIPITPTRAHRLAGDHGCPLIAA